MFWRVGIILFLLCFDSFLSDTSNHIMLVFKATRTEVYATFNENRESGRNNYILSNVHIN